MGFPGCCVACHRAGKSHGCPGVMLDEINSAVGRWDLDAWGNHVLDEPFCYMMKMTDSVKICVDFAEVDAGDRYFLKPALDCKFCLGEALAGAAVPDRY